MGDGLLSWLESGRVAGPVDPAAALPQPRTDGPWLERRYADEGELAHGLHTSIRRVVDLRMKRRVVMKVLDPRRVENEREAARFQEEARLTSVLEHPHSPPVYDAGEDHEGTRFFTLKLAEGGTLHDALSTPGYTASDDKLVMPLVDAIMRACDVVATAHAKGFWHCDVKPLNVTLAPHGQVYVLDWSSARLDRGVQIEGIDAAARFLEPGWGEPSLAPGKLLPSGAYIAPEQATGDLAHVGPWTDVFGLGATLYHVLTGQPPYPGPDLPSLLAQATNAEVRKPWELVRPAWPRRLGEVALKALSKDPAQRQQSVDELRRDIEQALQGGQLGEPRHFQPGSLIVREGETGDSAFILQKGRALVFKTIDGARVPVREIGAGEVVGETAIFSAKPRTASVEAIDQVTAQVITGATLEEEMGRTRWLAVLVRALADRFRDVDDRATRYEQVKDEAELAFEIIKQMVKKQTTSIPWMPVRVALSRAHKRTPPETLAIIHRIPLFYVDQMSDSISLVDPDLMKRA